MILPDDDICYRALLGRDARFDGSFYTGVRTTGIYCRPSCPAAPLRQNVTFHPTAAAAQRAGYRACKRCRPDASPGSPMWDVRGDVAGRALRMITDGAVDRDGVTGLAAALGYSTRQIHRALLAEVGAGPIALARAQRAQTARVLLETTDLAVARVAFAAGFASIRQFNDTIAAVFASTPTALRHAGRETGDREPGTLLLRLPYRLPMDVDATFAFLAAHATPGVETVEPGRYRRVVDAPGGPALVTIEPGAQPGVLRCAVRLADLRDLTAVVARVRRLFDLDADPVAVDAVLSTDPLLFASVAARPGLRSPGAADGFEVAIRAILEQQLSAADVGIAIGELVRTHGRVAFPGENWLLFPRPADLADCAPAALPLPGAVSATVLLIARLIVGGSLRLDAGANRERTGAALVATPGVGVGAAGRIRMRALSDPDVWLEPVVGSRSFARGNSPWRSYATRHLELQAHAPIAHTPHPRPEPARSA